MNPVSMEKTDCEMLDHKAASTQAPGLVQLSDSSASSSDYDVSNRSAFRLDVPSEIGCHDTCKTPNGNKVSFGQVEFRHHPIIMGDHPDCSCGPPFTIDWASFKARKFGVEEYETSRGPRRSVDDLKLGWIVRKQVLRISTGATDQEMREAACEAQRVRGKREKSLRQSQRAPMALFRSKITKAFNKSK